MSSGSLWPLLPAIADPLSPTGGQNSAAPGVIQNQATAEFQDSADNTNGQIVSDIVFVTVAEIAGISAAPSATLPINNGAATLALPTLYPTSTVYFDFVVKNEGNDPTKLFIPGVPSVATIGGTAVTPGQLTIINYNTVAPVTGTVTTTSASTAVDQATGIATNSVPAGGYVTVRVPITIPLGTARGAVINVTLGNTTGQPSSINTPYIVGANGTGGSDLYTQDNDDGTNGDTNGVPFNGDAIGHRQEASASQTATVIVPKVVISGKVYDDADNSANNTFTNTIPTNTEAGAIVTPPVYAVLVNSSNQVITSTQVINNGTGTTTTNGSNGTYSFPDVDGYQNGLYVILSSTSLSTGTTVTTTSPTLPTGWTATSPLIYPVFNVTNADTSALVTSYTLKDFGIEQLPETAPVSTASQANLTGVTASAIKYQVPTLSGSDPEDVTVTKFKIVTLPLAAEGILYYNNVAVIVGQEITGYDPTLLKFDPVDGPVVMSFTYASIDKASKVDPTPATATMTFSAGNVTISGTVYNDKDKSAITTAATGTTPTTFTNIKPNTVTGINDSGTDTKFGTNGTPIYATLVNSSGNVIASQLITSTGIYSFSDISASSNVKVILSTTIPGIAGSTAPTTGLPTGWLGTTAQDSGTFNTGLYGTDVAAGGFAPKDFGVIQKAKLVIVKRITKIGKTATTMQDTNPNDSTSLAGTSTDTFNFNPTNNPTVPSSYAGNWPAGYIVGATDAGKVLPGDIIEYTIYFLNNQGSDAKNVKICDPIRGSQKYVDNSTTLNLSSTSTAAGTGVSDTNSRLNVFSGNSVPTGCNGNGTNPSITGANNGGVAIDITTISTGTATSEQPVSIPSAVNPANPSNTTSPYGMFRFRTQVKP